MAEHKVKQRRNGEILRIPDFLGGVILDNKDQSFGLFRARSTRVEPIYVIGE